MLVEARQGWQAMRQGQSNIIKIHLCMQEYHLAIVLLPLCETNCQVRSLTIKLET